MRPLISDLIRKLGGDKDRCLVTVFFFNFYLKNKMMYTESFMKLLRMPKTNLETLFNDYCNYSNLSRVSLTGKAEKEKWPIIAKTIKRNIIIFSKSKEILFYKRVSNENHPILLRFSDDIYHILFDIKQVSTQSKSFCPFCIKWTKNINILSHQCLR